MHQKRENKTGIKTIYMTIICPPSLSQQQRCYGLSLSTVPSAVKMNAEISGITAVHETR